jgi:hypothetical protein
MMGERVLFADVTNVSIQPLEGPGRGIVTHGEPKAAEGGLCRGGGERGPDVPFRILSVTTLQGTGTAGRGPGIRT